MAPFFCATLHIPQLFHNNNSNTIETTTLVALLLRYINVSAPVVKKFTGKEEKGIPLAVAPLHGGTY